ncbi:glycine--tRNA ligase subunit beta [Ornithinibacillus xuwenensis]|uniref:Glycine--tRNA ligase beta subunit n=1 Tax=Ornithinibacillus xuwenensis TaxID=3144668 RepID=A0ABU9XCI9_9BACI
MAKNVLFEIGLEELPARFVDNAEKQLAERTSKWLEESRISFQSIETLSSPRRLAVFIHNIKEEQATIEEEVKGPAIKIAKDSDGNWSKAAIGFTKGQGKTVDDIYTKELKGITYIFVNKVIEGQPTEKILPDFKEIIESIQFGKNMRWGTQSMRYARPIRWLVALYGNSVIPFEISGVEAGNETFGHRFLGEKITLENPLEYKDKLQKNYVIVDSMKREQMILDGIKTLEETRGFQVPIDSDLLNEVKNLVEFPTVFVGSFEKEFLELPEEVLITSMKEHQRYFPVKSKAGALLPYFVAVRNGDNHAIETVMKGNEKVLRARLSDANFFYQEDQKHDIDFYVNKLSNVVFQEKLGTILDKVNRVVTISRSIAERLNLDADQITKVTRAAKLTKFDLMTNMVNEFTELQGVMGEKYARLFGEDEAVAKAISEHYMPTSATGELPSTLVGSIVSIADKLDTIVGCIGVGLKPTGSQDPYGLRRQAIGILKILNESKWNITVAELFQMVEELYQSVENKNFDLARLQEEITPFLRQRAAFVLKENGIEQDIIQAVTANELGVMPTILKKARILSEKRNDSSFKPVQEALSRVLNLAEKTEEFNVDSNLFETDSEESLFESYQHVQMVYQDALEQDKLDKAFSHIEELAEPIHTFFDHNMVMADDDAIRKNRLALLNRIGTLVNSFADLNAIEWKQHF